jgi:hypothetical protein
VLLRWRGDDGARSEENGGEERRKRKREARWLTVRYKKGKEKRRWSDRIGGWGEKCSSAITLAEDNRRRFRDPFIIKLDMASAEKKIHFLVMPRDDKIVFGGHWFGLKLAGIEF